MIGVVISCLIVCSPVIGYGFVPASPSDIGAPILANDTTTTSPGDQGAPPGDIGAPPGDRGGAPPGDIGGTPSDTAPPEELGLAPEELVSTNSTCPSVVSSLNVTDNASSVPNDNITTGFGSNTYDPRFILTRELILRDLSNLSPSEIKEYDLTDLSGQDIQSVLCMLTPGNLTKLLMNIPADQLLDIKGKLTPLGFQNVLDRLTTDTRTQVVNRVR